MQLTSGVPDDAFGPRKSIRAFTGLARVGCAFFWVSYNCELLFAAHVIMVIGASVFCINAVTRWFLPERKTSIGLELLIGLSIIFSVMTPLREPS